MTNHQPPTDPDTADEPLPGEAELAALYRQLPATEPSPALDAAVRQAAAQALGTSGTANTPLVERRKGPREPGDWVHPKPKAAARRRPPRWLIGLSSAATVVVAAGLAWHMHGQPQADAGAQSITADAAAPQAEAELGAPAPPPLSASPAPPLEPPKQPAPRLAAPPAPVAAVARESAAGHAQASNMAARAMTSPVEQAKRHAGDSAIAASRTASASGAAASQSPSPTAMAAAPAPLQEQAFGDAAPSNAIDAQARELEDIRRLFAGGHDEEAGRRLAAFRQAYPQRELPPDLKARLREP